MAKEYIERGALVERLSSIASEVEYADGKEDLFAYGALTGFRRSIIHTKSFPAADVVEVVRCKECQYAKPYERNDGQMGYYCQHQNCTFLYGTNWERLFNPIKEANDFCSYGERRTENGR